MLAERFGITVEAGTNEELIDRYNVALSQEVPIITANADQQNRAPEEAFLH